MQVARCTGTEQSIPHPVLASGRGSIHPHASRQGPSGPGKVRAITEQFLGWCCTRLQEAGVRVWALIWDNASWHVSKRVRAWIRDHNRQVKQQGQGVRILSCYLPVKSPWLNPIEPKWVHGKRAIVEPNRLLSAQEVADRVCAYAGCSHEPHLAIPDKVA